MRISIFVSPQLQALRTRLRELPAEARKQIRVQSKADALPIWRESVQAHTVRKADALLFLNTARVAVSDRNINLQAARVGKKLRGGLNIRTQWQGFEFGADRDQLNLIRTRAGGQAKRHTMRQLPSRKRNGRVVYPAISEAVPRILALWVQTVARAGADAHRG